jgi:uncharacterized protein (TIGR03435 family)
MLRTLLFLAATLCLAQTPPAFDVASLKPSGPLEPGRTTYNANLGTIRNGEVVLTNATLADCLKFAYTIASDDQIDAPDWVKSKDVRFDVLGKAPVATPREEMLAMLRGLLTERFHLTTHNEQRRIPHLSLTVARNGPKLKEVERDPSTSHMTYRIGSITHNQISMPLLAMLISRQLRQPVLDQTGRKGVYDVKLEWTPDTPDGAARDGPSIFTAVQEQLGLRLENSRDPMEVLVIDHADRTPVAN